MTILEVFMMASPLITYPYLIKILGKELYGYVITAQIIASYCSIFVTFGFKTISARHVSIHRNSKEKLSEIISAIVTIRAIIWLLFLIIYIIVINIIPLYREYYWLFMISYFLTIQDLLFPRFFFQGIEKMKYITIINVIIRTVFIIFTFAYIKQSQDYILVPGFMSLGYLIGGGVSLYFIFFKEGIPWSYPTKQNLLYHLKDGFPIFSTDIVASLKDKFSYLLIGSFIGMGEVVIFDLGAKFMNIMVKPSTIFSSVLFPKIAKENNVKLFKQAAKYSAIGSIIIFFLFNLMLPFIVSIFISEEIDLLPLRVFLLAPLFLSLSSFISTNGIIAFGHNKIIFYSILITSGTYLFLTALMYQFDLLNTVLTFISISVSSYLVELVYRIYVAHKIMNKVKCSNSRNIENPVLVDSVK